MNLEKQFTGNRKRTMESENLTGLTHYSSKAITKNDFQTISNPQSAPTGLRLCSALSCVRPNHTIAVAAMQKSPRLKTVCVSPVRG